MNSKLFGTMFACAMIAVSCKSTPTTSASPDAAASASGAAAASAPNPSASSSAGQSPLAIPGATVATLPNMSFPERFGAESKGRPAGIKPSAEEVFTALKAAGLEIVDIKQHLAAPQGARFCLGARAVGPNKETRLDISACEYATPDVARIGRDYSLESMKSVIPNRTVYLNKQTTLTVREAEKTPELDALVDKASAAFAKL